MPLKCHFRDHSNNDYAIEYYEDERVEIIDETLIKFQKANSQKTFAEQVLFLKQNEYFSQILSD